ncbi:outer membrane protein [Aquimarina sp. EL_43]|uniref:OmpH family outer membrane protein n=1 Tax=Aquimarina TaxID=290174 RepID=UPI0004724ED7|nr:MULTISPECIES: OmpH family outer membrane protein [Aquimarina]MBG6133058.1 outer membrane protein [Aquimarina sp. EL_35]MBG6153216.1 outer membrane protein [Aquimarina sp. EL_32]MBG6171515.1 outer membrane protein [Aquimarina sp. EL_43]
MRKIVWVASALLILASCNQQIEKTGYVNNTKVVSDFKEMKAAQEKWTKRNNEVRAELEEKAKQFQIEVEGYKNIMKSMSAANREKKEQELMVKQQGLQREQQAKMQEIQQGSQAEIDSIIGKVKSFIEDYGKKNGYTYIYGDTETSNILYGKEELNLTDKILTELNGGDTTTTETKE